jgi:hypothetical protein
LGLSDLKYFSNKRKPGKTKAFFICLLIASFLWLVHALNTVYNYTIRVPVTFKNMPQNKKTLVEIPSALFVQLKASGLKLCLILLNRPFTPVEVDFNNLKSVNRNQSYVLSSSEIDFEKSFKFETQIKHISPDTLYFAEKTGFQKIVPVKASVYVKCKPGYGHKTTELDPSFITIWGDTALIRKVDTIYTQPLNLTEVDKDVDHQLAFIKPDPGVYTPFSETHLKIKVAKLIEQTLVLPVSAVFKQNNRQVNIFPSKVKIKFTCLQNFFNVKDTGLFRVIVNGDKINPATRKSPVFLSATPKDITVMSVEPEEVEILIIKNQ